MFYSLNACLNIGCFICTRSHWIFLCSFSSSLRSAPQERRRVWRWFSLMMIWAGSSGSWRGCRCPLHQCRLPTKPWDTHRSATSLIYSVLWSIQIYYLISVFAHLSSTGFPTSSYEAELFVFWQKQQSRISATEGQTLSLLHHPY